MQLFYKKKYVQEQFSQFVCCRMTRVILRQWPLPIISWPFRYKSEVILVALGQWACRIWRVFRDLVVATFVGRSTPQRLRIDVIGNGFRCRHNRIDDCDLDIVIEPTDWNILIQLVGRTGITVIRLTRPDRNMLLQWEDISGSFIISQRVLAWMNLCKNNTVNGMIIFQTLMEQQSNGKNVLSGLNCGVHPSWGIGQAFQSSVSVSSFPQLYPIYLWQLLPDCRTTSFVVVFISISLYVPG